MSSSYQGDDRPAPGSTTWDPLGPKGVSAETQLPPGLPPALGQQPRLVGEPAQSHGHQAYQQQTFQQPGQAPPTWVAPVPVYPYAVWIRRVGAYLIDFAPIYVAMIPFWIGYVMLYVRLVRATMSGDPAATTDGVTGTPLVLLGVGCVLLLAAFGWQWHNRWLVAGRTGQSMGKRVLNTTLVAEVNGRPIGPVNAFLRDLLHVLDGMACVGYLWPLWDTKRQTFADMIMKTVVVDLRVHPAGRGAGHHEPRLSTT